MSDARQTGSSTARAGGDAWRSRAAALAPALLWAIGLASAFQATLRRGLDHFQIHPGDPRLVQYLLEHGWRWLGGDPRHDALRSPPVFHPALGMGASTDTVLGVVPLYGAARALGMGPDPAFQTWMALCLSLDFVAAWVLLARGLGRGRAPAALGAFLFAFGSARLASFNSPQLFPLFYGVFALHALLRGLEPGRTRRSAAAWIHGAAVLLALQLWSTWYPSYFWILILALAALGALVFRDTRAALGAALRRNGPALVSAALLGALVVAPMLQAHLAAAAERGWRPWADVVKLLPVWGSWLYTGPTHGLYGGLAFGLPPGPVPPHANGVGFVTLALAVLGLWRTRRRPVARLVATATLLTVLVSLRWPDGDHSLWALAHAWLPGAGSIRYVARIGLFLPLAAGIGVALLFDAPGWRRGRRLGLGLVLAAVCVAEQLHVLDVPDTPVYRERLHAIASELDPGCESFFLHVERPPRPSGEGAWRGSKLTHILAMGVSLETGVPTVNGLLGGTPPGWGLHHAEVHDAASRAELERRLAGWLEAHGLPPENVCRIRLPRARPPAPARWVPIAP